MSTVENLTQDTFEQALEEPGIMVVDFWAGWLRQITGAGL